MSKVRNLDRPDQPDRLIRLYPRDAVLWCMAEHLGMRGATRAVEHYLDRVPNGWTCGPFWVEEHHG